MLKTLNVESTFVDGLRVTDQVIVSIFLSISELNPCLMHDIWEQRTMEVAQMVLCGSINKEIASKINGKEGVFGSIGLSGLDAGLIKAVQKDERLGLVGEPTKVNAEFLRQLLQIKIVPVIAPIGSDEKSGGSLNINADTAAGAVAEALQADYFLLLTDIVGVLDKTKTLIPVISIAKTSVESLKADGTISGGMIPKLETASKVTCSITLRLL